MAVLLTDYSKTIDLLSTANNRIEIVSANNFVLKFPSAITSAYKVVTPTLKLIYGLELTRTSGVKRLFEGTITVKREQTK